jgi:hypothetical protein
MSLSREITKFDDKFQSFIESFIRKPRKPKENNYFKDVKCMGEIDNNSYNIHCMNSDSIYYKNDKEYTITKRKSISYYNNFSDEESNSSNDDNNSFNEDNINDEESVYSDNSITIDNEDIVNDLIYDEIMNILEVGDNLFDILLEDIKLEKNRINNENRFNNKMSNKEEKIIGQNIKFICKRLTVISKMNVHDKLWIDEDSDGNIIFSLDSPSLIGSFMQPLYRYRYGQGRVKIINQIIHDTNFLTHYIPCLKPALYLALSKIIKKSINGLEIIRQKYNNHEERMKVVITRLGEIINDSKLSDINEYIDIKAINDKSEEKIDDDMISKTDNKIGENGVDKLSKDDSLEKTLVDELNKQL